MASIQVKNVAEELHRAARDRASDAGMTLSDYVLGLIRRDLQFPTRSQWLERVRGRERVDADVHSALEEERGRREEAIGGAGRS
jgi:hypothetical protein